MSKMLFATALLLTVLTNAESLSAQQRYNELVDSTLSIQRDARLDSLVMRHIRLNKQKDGLDGYRVQLFSGSGTTAREEANDLRAEFMGNHPDIPAYLLYQTPNFKVRVGDFRTELEAMYLQRELAYQYPGGFVVRDEIKFPQLAIEKEKESEEDLEIPSEQIVPE
jgi:hypothetical protein